MGRDEELACSMNSGTRNVVTNEDPVSYHNDCRIRRLSSYASVGRRLLRMSWKVEGICQDEGSRSTKQTSQTYAAKDNFWPISEDISALSNTFPMPGLSSSLQTCHWSSLVRIKNNRRQDAAEASDTQRLWQRR